MATLLHARFLPSRVQAAAPVPRRARAACAPPRAAAAAAHTQPQVGSQGRREVLSAAAALAVLLPRSVRADEEVCLPSRTPRAQSLSARSIAGAG